MKADVKSCSFLAAYAARQSGYPTNFRNWHPKICVSEYQRKTNLRNLTLPQSISRADISSPNL
jgi:hypothetical protein